MVDRRTILPVAACLVLIAFAASAAVAAEGKHSGPTPIFPKALVPGDTVMIVAPAKYLDKERVLLAKKRLEKLEFRVKVPENLFRKKGFIGGSDDEHAAELMVAI